MTSNQTRALRTPALREARQREGAVSFDVTTCAWRAARSAITHLYQMTHEVAFSPPLEGAKRYAGGVPSRQAAPVAAGSSSTVTSEYVCEISPSRGSPCQAANAPTLSTRLACRAPRAPVVAAAATSATQSRLRIAARAPELCRFLTYKKGRQDSTAVNEMNLAGPVFPKSQMERPIELNL